MKQLIIILFSALLVSACGIAPPKKLSRADWLKMTTRTYHGIGKNDLLIKIEQLFELADETDLTMTHFENGLIATRHISAYLVITAITGNYRWDVKVNETQDGTTVTTYMYANLNGHSAVATGPNSAAPITASYAGGNALNRPMLYDLYWSRLDYLTGNSDHWMTCKKKAELTNTSLMGELDALCYKADDKVPEGANLALPQRALKLTENS